MQPQIGFNDFLSVQGEQEGEESGGFGKDEDDHTNTDNGSANNNNLPNYDLLLEKGFLLAAQLPLFVLLLL